MPPNPELTSRAGTSFLLGPLAFFCFAGCAGAGLCTHGFGKTHA